MLRWERIVIKKELLLHLAYWLYYRDRLGVNNMGGGKLVALCKALEERASLQV